MASKKQIKVVKIDPCIGICTVCGQKDDVRPYGKDGAVVCFDCATNDPDESDRQFHKLVEGADLVILAPLGKKKR